MTKCHVNAVQGDITVKTVPIWLHLTVDESTTLQKWGESDIQGDQLNMAMFFGTS